VAAMHGVDRTHELDEILLDVLLTALESPYMMAQHGVALDES